MKVSDLKNSSNEGLSHEGGLDENSGFAGVDEELELVGFLPQGG